MEDGNTPPSGGTAEPLTIRGAVNQLVGERRTEPAPTPTPPIPSPAADDAPDPADLEALEASEAPDAPEPEKPRYRLDDGYEATLDEIAEWRKGALRQQDYTRKTQELSEQRRQFAAQWQGFQQNTQAYKQAIDQAIAVVTHFLPQPPSEELRKQDFFAWQERKADYDAQIGKLQSLHAQRQQIAQAETVKQQQAYARQLQKEQQTLLARRPDLRDPAKAAKFSQDITKFGVENGYTPREVNQIRDARLLNVVEKAMKWDKLQASKAKLSEKAKDAAPMAPVSSPARRQSGAEREAASLAPLKKAFETSADSGTQASLRAAAKLLQAERAASLRK